jgi:DNA-binding transcriptional LysR family regulator
MDDLSSGRLEMPLEAALFSTQAFYVVTASGNALSPRVAAFRDWLLTEAQYSPA